jgi:hypothetical protein
MAPSGFVKECAVWKKPTNLEFSSGIEFSEKANRTLAPHEELCCFVRIRIRTKIRARNLTHVNHSRCVWTQWNDHKGRRRERRRICPQRVSSPVTPSPNSLLTIIIITRFSIEIALCVRYCRSSLSSRYCSSITRQL